MGGREGEVSRRKTTRPPRLGSAFDVCSTRICDGELSLRVNHIDVPQLHPALGQVWLVQGQKNGFAASVRPQCESGFTLPTTLSDSDTLSSSATFLSTAKSDSSWSRMGKFRQWGSHKTCTGTAAAGRCAGGQSEV